MKSIYFKSDERGHANHGWLNSYHTFSFGNYYEPTKMNFGSLRVLNDDTVSGSMGFGEHPHENMEIVSIPLEGSLEHKDSIGNKAIITTGEVQIMSAGTGIYHSEKNNEVKTPVKFLQIWVYPDKLNIAPRYEQKQFEVADRQNKFQTIVSPLNTSDEGIKINQNAWFSLINLNKSNNASYDFKDNKNGVFVFVLEGNASINNKTLNKRDGLGITDCTNFEISATDDVELLIMEIPMQF